VSLRLVKVEMSESIMFKEKYQINALPMFIMYYNGKIVVADPLGGRKQRMPYAKNYILGFYY